MGCDIHFYVERRVGGVWQSADKWYTDPDNGEPGTTDWSNYNWSDPSENRDIGRPFYQDRNYDLFSILADVQNGRGFAGIRTGDGFKPIAYPRGLPDDCSAEVRRASDAYGIDGHSHSSHTVAELMAYDWTQVTRKSGVAGIRDLARWKINGKPERWSDSIGGGGVETFKANAVLPRIEEILGGMPKHKSGQEFSWYSLFHVREDFAHAVVAGVDPLVDEFWTRLTTKLGRKQPVFSMDWSVHYYEVASDFLSGTLPRLWRLGKPEDVRIVFWFDN